MTPSRVTLALLLVVVCVLLAAGCAGEESCLPHSNTIPWIQINPIGNHSVSDKFIISGTTNLDVGTELSVSVYEPVHSCPYGAHCVFLEQNANVSVIAGKCGVNIWSYTPNLSGYSTICEGDCPGAYVSVRTLDRITKNETSFHVTAKPQLPLPIIKRETAAFTKKVYFSPVTLP
jgi:hypothetical protein